MQRSIWVVIVSDSFLHLIISWQAHELDDGFQKTYIFKLCFNCNAEYRPWCKKTKQINVIYFTLLHIMAHSLVVSSVNYFLKLHWWSWRSRNVPLITFKCTLFTFLGQKIQGKVQVGLDYSLSHVVPVLSRLLLDNPEMLGIMGSKGLPVVTGLPCEGEQGWADGGRLTTPAWSEMASNANKHNKMCGNAAQ